MIVMLFGVAGCGSQGEATPGRTAPVVGLVASVSGLSGPEAVRYDPEQDLYFVANFNGEASGDANGFVSKISAEGEILELKFMQGSERWPLHGARGMFIDPRGLWVVDADGVHLFDRESGEQIGFTDLSDFEPGFPNDIALAADGALYVTDTGKKVIYRISDGIASVATSTAMKPNGITVNPESGGLLLAPWADSQAVVEWNFAEDSFSEVGLLNGGGNFDGIEVVNGHIILASQQDTSLHIMTGGVDRRVIVLPGKPADIGIDTRRNRVAVPYVSLNRVDIISLDGYL